MPHVHHLPHGSQNGIDWSRVASYGAHMTESQPATTIPTSSKVLCAAYGVIAIAALIATWSQNIAYLDKPYLLGGLLIAISVTFPLFLIARERRIAAAQPTRLGRIDTAALVLLAAASAVFVIWVDVG